jgi:thiamine-monophosphate kinase
VSNEFEIIERYFGAIGEARDDIVLGIGDDGAVVDVPQGQQLVVTMDTLVEGIHFPTQTDPADIAYKALAVNVSDLAAMAANPAWFLLSLTLPAGDNEWLARFSAGLAEAAGEFRIALIGGDTCLGPLSVSIQAAGLVPRGEFVPRGGATFGDLVLVSGCLGNAALGLADLRGEIDLPPELRANCLQALQRPRPRLELEPFLRRYASAAIDISDGLLGDLQHILDASGVGAEIERAAIPVHPWIEQRDAWEYALEAGDDYEICCTVAARQRGEIEAWNLAHPDCPLTAIGKVTTRGLRLRGDAGLVDAGGRGGYRHFD